MLHGLLAAFGIGLLIFIHELGHYLAARSIGVRVEVFSLGFGPRLLGFRKGDTDYRISAVPLGGYVQVTGQDPMDPRHGDPGALIQRTVGQRFWFFSAGVLMNLLLALVAFPFVFAAGVEFAAPIVGSVTPGGPAWMAGVEPGDRVLRLNGKELYSFENMGVEVALAGHKPIELVVQRGEEEKTLTVNAEYDKQRGLYGMGVKATEDLHHIEFLDPSSDAAKALRSTDVILKPDGTPADLAWVDQSIRQLSPYQSSDYELTVDRDGERITTTLATQKLTLPTPKVGVGLASRRVAGFRPKPEIVALGLKQDDVIVAMDGTHFAGMDWAEALGEGSGPLQLSVIRYPKEGDPTTRITARQQLTLESRDPKIRGILRSNVALGPDDLLPALLPQDGSPAADAGMRTGDTVFAVDGKPIRSWTEFRTAVRAASDPAKPLAFSVRRPSSTGGPSEELSIAVTPGTETYVLPLQLKSAVRRQVYQTDGIGESIKTGFIATADLIKQLYVTLKGMFTGQVGANNLGGIITIGKVSYDMAQWGLPRFFYFLALLSINLAVINLLPIPVLDGGHLLFLLVEKVRGAPVPERMFHYGQVLGLVLVLALVVFTFYNDLARYL